ncbi:aspartate--ammonia ligase [Salinimicrobium sp. TH3]|uniref:aspartate--ammonia ligase n=1 Tax=Salinimicrobium sp. TH3 TaxID=2997342 RepID=UPI002276B63E|nr:aspartate--ammonia ligase [Salinimicrobium sp. TH3]MCY2685978.1 aspartate--ammonia ligase [Salinimicrobium sp. TH3]
MKTTLQQQSQKLETEEAVHFVKAEFEKHLKEKLSLVRVSAPTVVLQGTGINDDLNGIERPVGFPIKEMQEQRAEVVQSLAKWKRLRLKEYELEPGLGIVTDMKALRPDDELGPMHSISVDQWDWEKVMAPEDRHLEFLKQQVSRIYEGILATEAAVTSRYPLLTPILPAEITFLHTEDLQEKYPRLSSKERENMAAKEYGAVFLIGIGGELQGGEFHDGRAPDYDDWSSPTSATTKGLNGDILVWNPVLEKAFELSSMGIRVDAAILEQQLKMRQAETRSQLFYHKQLLEGKLPQTIGGGIGQSRLCMFLLRKEHIGEVQVSIWPEAMRKEMQRKRIYLL